MATNSQRLEVTCHLAGPVFLPGGWLALDALLAAMVARRDGYPPPGFGPLLPIEIPVERETEGRFHLASFFLPAWECWEQQWTNRRPVIFEAQGLGDAKLTRMSVATGPNKAYRNPRQVGHAESDRLTAWCVGDPEAIRALLALCGHVGKKTAAGLGRVSRWEVAHREGWDGFPVLAPGGVPLRPLPLRWPKIALGETAYGRLSYPYWEGERVLCAVPEVGL